FVVELKSSIKLELEFYILDSVELEPSIELEILCRARARVASYSRPGST
ncbi:hypothetical protein CCACVL1_07001, partial [Corchorus capsularis]